jgi:hypothetical protein
MFLIEIIPPKIISAISTDSYFMAAYLVWNDNVIAADMPAVLAEKKIKISNSIMDGELLDVDHIILMTNSVIRDAGGNNVLTGPRIISMQDGMLCHGPYSLNLKSIGILGIVHGKTNKELERRILEYAADDKTRSDAMNRLVEPVSLTDALFK